MSKYKDKKPSMIEFTRKYANNDQACEDFFFRAKYPNGYYCEKCGCTHYRKISTRNHVYTCSKCRSSVMSVCRNNLSGLQTGSV